MGERLETGPVRCGDDWAGLFIRGDDARWFLGALESLIGSQEATTVDLLRAGQLRGLLMMCQEPCNAVPILRVDDLAPIQGEEKP